MDDCSEDNIDFSEEVEEVEEMLSDFEMTDEEDMDDDYFKQYVDVGVGDVLDEVVGSSQLMIVRPNQGEENMLAMREENMLAVREENMLAIREETMLLSDYESEEIEEVYAMSNDENEIVVQRKNSKYNPSEMCKDFQFKKGMEFTSLEEFKDAVREYALLNGYELKFVKNDKVRCRVKCAHKECEWLVFVSKGGDGDLTYAVKTLYPNHTCGVSIKGKNATYKWVSEKIKNVMKTNKNFKLAHVIASVREHYMVDVSVWKASKVRKRAKAMIEGDYKEQYHKLKDYANEVKRCNPETTFVLVTDRPYADRPPIFRRIYECIGAVKREFLAGCRPIIGLDGCFLKGPYGGILLVAVARDANDQYFPLAWAVVEGENRDSWTWFLQNLLDDIGSMRERQWVFISDQQKGLVPTFDELLEGAEHRFCVRHLYANVKAKYGGGTVVRDLILRAAKATVKAEWRERMNELKEVSKEAHDYLLAIPPTCWTKSHFRETCKCNMVTNNITESFNGRLLEARELPIVSMLDWIRTYLMTRFVENRVKAEKYREKSIVCPRPRKRLEREIQECRRWEARYAGYNRFEVSLNRHKFQVDLTTRSCTCYWWQLNGIPCRHAAACIYGKREDPYEYVDKYLCLQSFVASYSPVIEPINGENMWEKADGEPIDPPPYHKRPGRPPKNRKRGADDQTVGIGKQTRVNTIIKCSNCQKPGHNRRSCKQPVVPATIPVKQRSKKINQASSTQESINATPPTSSQP